MIPYIRSLSELMALTASRDKFKDSSNVRQINSLLESDSNKQRFIKPSKKERVELPDLKNTLRHKLILKRKSLSKFIDQLDYNNQIQSSYDLTLLEQQNSKIYKDVA